MSKKKKIKILSGKQAEEYKKKRKKNIPHLTSMSII
jgi:hypothetical protein